MNSRDVERDLFELPPRGVEPAAFDPEHQALAAQLSKAIRLGGMSWSYPGWRGHVYGFQVAPKHLSNHGLTAYAQHPLFRAVEIDRTYYEPVGVSVLRAFAQQVSGDFRFLAKAHEDCTVMRFPSHARYGKKRGQHNPRFLDASYAENAVIGPLREGLGERLGVLLFQFPPQDVGDPLFFAERLHAFLQRLPRGVPYAVELRNQELLTPKYAAGLESAGVVHCHNVWPAMPPLLAQVRQIPPGARRPLIVRWLMRQGDDYEGASSRFAPFDRLREEDVANRAAIADLVVRADRHGVPAFVLVDNKAEGCAPESIARLARAIVESASTR